MRAGRLRRHRQAALEFTAGGAKTTLTDVEMDWMCGAGEVGAVPTSPLFILNTNGHNITVGKAGTVVEFFIFTARGWASDDKGAVALVGTIDGISSKYGSNTLVLNALSGALEIGRASCRERV